MHDKAPRSVRPHYALEKDVNNGGEKSRRRFHESRFYLESWILLIDMKLTV